MSYAKCCVPGCSGATGSQKHVLHYFPNPAKDLSRFRLWLFNIGGDILQLSNEYIYKNRRVCHSHFEEKYFCRFNRINNIAVPTVNMPDLSNKFTSTNSVEKRPLGQIQNLPEAGPSAAKDEYVLFGPEETKGYNLLRTNEKENIVKKASDMKSYGDTININQQCTENFSSIHVESISSQTLSCSNNSASKRKANEMVPDINQGYAKKGKTPSKKVTRRTRRIRMTRAEKDLYLKLVSANRKVSKYRNKIAKKSRELKVAKKLCSNPTFLKVMENLPKSAKVLTLLQFRELTKKEKGRRFTIKEKIIALSIFKQSPKSYRFLRKIYLLPSPQTLIKLLSKAKVKPGINKKIFAQLKTKATEMKPNEKICILLFDEMSIKSNVSYNERKDKVTGFVTNGNEIQPIFANHAQVFMIRGLIKNYKQPISYTFSSGATKGPELANQIKEIIKALNKAGFQVVATVCDQGSNNRQSIKCLINEARGIFIRRGETPKDNVFIVDDKEIVPLYDPPHLLKGIRNNLLSKDLLYETDGEVKIAKWHHLELLHKENPGYKGVRLVPKLTDKHIVPQKIGKMKVKYASQVFSRAVVSSMGYLADKGVLPNDCKNTADLLLFFDGLFDSVNGSYTKKSRFGKPLLGPVTPMSDHHETWTEAKKILKSMKFINASGKKEIVPTINNWVWTLDGIQVLVKKLDADYNITSVWMRHLNQDPIENFFGAIRSHGCRDTNPTPERFESAYTTLLVNSLTSVHAPGGNCENDLGKVLFTLVTDEGCKADDEVTTRETEIDMSEILSIELEPIERKKGDPKIFAPLQYISGYFVHKIKKIYKKCETCQNALISNQPIEYIKYREYAGRRWLCSPSDSIVNVISNLQDAIMAILKKDLEKNNLKAYLNTVIYMSVDLKTVSCDNHKDKLLDILINTVCRFFIYNYCKNINKIMYGKKDVDDKQDKFQLMAKDYFKKHLKMKK